MVNQNYAKHNLSTTKSSLTFESDKRLTKKSTVSLLNALQKDWPSTSLENIDVTFEESVFLSSHVLNNVLENNYA